jgi:hypothetical protein
MTMYSPQQNGVVERRNAMVVGAARSMLKQKGLPDWFGGGGSDHHCLPLEHGALQSSGWQDTI